MAEGDWESHPEGWGGLGGHPGGQEGVMRPFWRAAWVERARKGQKFLQEGQEGLEGPPRGLGEVGRPSRWSGRDREALPKG